MAAAADADAIQQYIAAENLRAAGRVRERIGATAERLLTRPMIGRAGKIPRTRELVVPRSPYVIVYRLVEDVVEVLRVLHGAQRWPPVEED